MNASQSLPARLLSAHAAGEAVSGVGGVSPFQRLLEGVWREQAQSLAAVAGGLGLRGEQAADALQDVYLAALERPPAIAEAGELKGWLYRVMVNRCHLEQRQRARWGRLWRSLALTWQGAANGTPVVPLRELSADVEAALVKLSDEDRALVAMRYFAELNSREIGEALSLPEATVRGRLRAARRKLAEVLKEWSDE